MFTSLHKRVLIADLALLAIVAIWGATFIVIKQGLEDLPPVLAIVYRFGLASIFMLTLVLVRRKNPLKMWRWGLGVGFCMWVIFVSQYIGMQFTSAAHSAFITALFVVFVPLLMIIFFKHWPSWPKLVAVLLSLLGLWFITGGFERLNKGDLITLIAAFGCAVHILTNDYALKHGHDALVMGFQQFFLIFILSVFWQVINRQPFLPIPTSAMSGLLFLAFPATVLAFGVANYVQKISTPMRVAIIYSFEPVFALYFAWFLGGEQITNPKLGGILLLFLALVLAEMPLRNLSFLYKFATMCGHKKSSLEQTAEPID